MKKLISWVEIPATNFERAVDFYKTVFKIEMEVFDWGKEKMACFPNDEGAISFSPGFKPGVNGPLVSFNAEKELDKTIEIILEMGGKITIPNTKIEAEGRGYFAVFIDCEGNKVGLYGDN